ncbi:unnamed protein product [Phyllotreta striolata]|uniref:Zinc carboxypeptidase A 1 n=1 Tax=Phyllotreta striolata TaxID=444603 RepID=A0A9N9TMV7_PHYSR|nr:unnamed protein product [Phyllotreta striolata]
MKLVLLIPLGLLAFARGDFVKYDDYTVYKAIPENENQLATLKSLQHDITFQLDFWTEPKKVGIPVDIMVPPERKEYVQDTFERHQIKYDVMIENVQSRIDEEKLSNEQSKLSTEDFNWSKYHTLEEINNWLMLLTKTYPDKVTLVNGGSSYEGRKILGVKVSFRPGNENKTVWIDSLIHAREWIAGATSTFILNQLLTSTNSTIRSTAESHDWYFFPVINPDGYAYTHSNDRMWRKTRTPYGRCFGTDPNRNWDYKWSDGGSTNDPCSDVYAGPKPFSEIETRSLSEYMKGVAKQLELFITFHSYSQLMLIPYGHTTAHLDNYNITYPVGLKAVASLAQKYGTQYSVGDIAEIIYVATGSNMDWLKANYHVPFAYAYELRDQGQYGFLLPTEQIVPTGEETLDSIITILKEADKYID